jgi:hypothetical protein
MSFKKAVKEQAKLRLALDGLAGSGKTFSALAIGSAIGSLMRKHGHGEGRMAVIDSERGSASLYADKFDFDVVELDSFSPLAYVERIREAEGLGYDIIIADSITHAWAGKGGALDQKDQAAERSPTGNSWTAWRSVTPKHNALVDAMLQCKAHFIATMRVKMEYVQEKDDKGKTAIKKVGLQSIQREGMEYEFTLVGDLDLTHTLKISKTRAHGAIEIGDQFEKPGELFAGRVYSWLMSGAAPTPAPRTFAPAAAPTTEPAATNAETVPATAPVVAALAPVSDASTEVATELDKAFAAYLLDMSEATMMADLDRAATGPAKPAKGTPGHKLATETYLRSKAAITRRLEQAKQAEQPTAVAS